jgi:hypothetical protein
LFIAVLTMFAAFMSQEIFTTGASKATTASGNGRLPPHGSSHAGISRWASAIVKTASFTTAAAPD